MTNFSSSPAPISLPLEKISDEVFMATDEVVRFDSRYVDFIKQSAAKNARGRARICAHRGPVDALRNANCLTLRQLHSAAPSSSED